MPPVRQPVIRAEVLRYVATIATTLRSYTVPGRTKALRVFFDYPDEEHPEVTRLDQIDRVRHIEPYLAWAQQRPWRGRNRDDKTVGLTVFHQDGSTCAASSKTSPGGAGRRRRRASCCSTATSHDCPMRCPGR